MYLAYGNAFILIGHSFFLLGKREFSSGEPSREKLHPDWERTVRVHAMEERTGSDWSWAAHPPQECKGRMATGLGCRENQGHVGYLHVISLYGMGPGNLRDHLSPTVSARLGCSGRVGVLQLSPIKCCHFIGPRKHTFSVMAPVLWNSIPRERDCAPFLGSKKLRLVGCIMIWLF